MITIAEKSAGYVVRNDQFVRTNVVESIIQGLSAENSLGTNNSKVRTSKEVLLLVIEAFVDQQELTVSDIHLVLDMSRSTAGRAIIALTACGAIQRISDGRDRRRKIVALSPSSARIVNEIINRIGQDTASKARLANSNDGDRDTASPGQIDYEYQSDNHSPDVTTDLQLAMYQYGSQLSGIGHVIWDPINDKCLFASQEAAHMFDLTVDDFLAASATTKGFVDLLHPVERGKMRRFIEHFRTGDTISEVTYHLVGENGDAGRYLLHKIDYLPSSENEPLLEIHVLNDITKQIHGVLSLNQVIEAAEHSTRLRGEFISHFSHELRTPLNAIMGFAQLLESEVFSGHANTKYSEYLRDIHDSGLHLLDIVNDVLDLSKLEAGRMRIDDEPFDVDDMISSTTQMIMQQAQNNRIAIHTEVKKKLPKLIADELRVRQILINLLSNAVKFTDPDGHIEIVADCDSQGAILIEVRDSGIGIPPDELENVMEPFQQVSKKSGGKPATGTGLGLALVKFLADLHDAEFSLDSSMDKGTTAVLRFPPERSARLQ